MRRALLILMILFVLLVGLPQARAVKVGKNVNVTGEASPDRQVNEPYIAVDPRNPSIVVAGAMDDRLVSQGGHWWDAYYRSTDGGMTWSSRLLPGFLGDTSPQGLTSPLRAFATQRDSVVAFDRSGNVYYSGLTNNLTDSGSVITNTDRTFVAKFANDGADFVRATVIPTVTEFPRMAVDTSGGVNDGNIYVVFLDFPGSGGGVFVRSTDGGLTFSKPISIAVPFHDNTAVTTDPAGNVYVVTLQCMGHGGSCSNAPAQILVSKSTDGGLSFQPFVVAANIVTDPPIFPGNQFFIFPLLSSAPQMSTDSNGVLYIVSDDFSSGNSNVVLTKSTDGGLTWSSLLRINDVAFGQHFLPTIAVSGGVIGVAWYDSRLGQLANGTITGLDLFYAQSRDGGSSFSANLRVTSVSFDPNLVLSPDLFLGVSRIGDYISIAASPDAVRPIWADNRNACDTIVPTFGCQDQDVFTATIIP